VVKNELYEEWEKRMAEFRASGQSATAWCAAHEINLQRFRYWARKFQVRPQTESTKSVQWLSVKLDESPVSEGTSMNVQVGEASIEVRPGFNPILLKQIVQALAHAK